MNRSKRSSKSTQKYSKEDLPEIDESESSSKKDKKRIKLKKTQEKKVKLLINATYTPQAEAKLNYIYNVLLDNDTENVLSGEDLVSDNYTQDDNFALLQQWYRGYTEKKSKLQSLGDFKAKIDDNYYWTEQQIQADLNKLFRNTHLRLPNSYGYLVQLWNQSYPKMKNHIEQFNAIKQADFEQQLSLSQDFKIVLNKWPIVPNIQEMRQYKVLEDYEPNPPAEPHISQINKKLASEKKPVVCKSDCVCFSLEKMGHFSYEKITWESECPNRVNRIECETHEGTDNKCYNMQIQLKQHTHLNVDVEEEMCWGIDIYTRNNVLSVLPKSLSEKTKQDFISFQLMKAINQQKEKGYDMKQACDYIISESKKQYNEQFNHEDKLMAKAIKKALHYDAGFQGFRIHTKGLGLVCINYQGIKSNQLIIPYLGEIYQPWRWYEKQDFIKKQMKDYNQKDVLPDFYNIMLDIHKNDPKGIDYLFVDPINKGNYSSRLSHSCNPNCGTVTCVSNGKYVIGMYAMRDIKYGEELTFDYCSTTESKAEYQQALCLCGYEKCKVRYLQLSNSKEYNAILDKEHCFLSRNAILLKACTQDGIHDEELLKKYKLGKSVFEDLPPWLHSWAVQVLQFIDTEKTLYKAELDCKYAQDYDTNKWNGLVVQQHCDDRIQNLIFTLDKIKYFLLKSKSDSPPMIKLKDQVLLEDLWSDYMNNNNSLVNELYELFSKHNLKAYLEIISTTNANKKKLSTSEQLLITRVMFLVLSHLLQQHQHQFHSEALSIILYFMAFTYTYFRPFDYDGFSSESFEEIEWRKVGAFKRKMKSETRNYSSQFVWGQLIGWFKQTVANPQASLSQDRRGTLSYPSFIQSFDKFEKTYPFQSSKNTPSRQYFLEHLLEKPSYMWPPEQASWSYKNTYKLYGTIVFEQYFSDILGQDFLDQVIPHYSDTLDYKISLMIKYEQLKFGHSEQAVNQCVDILRHLAGDNVLKVQESIKPAPRYRRTILSYFRDDNTSKRERLFDEIKQQGRPEHADFLHRFSKIFSIVI